VLGGIEQGGGATARRSNFQRSDRWRCSDFPQSNPSGPWSRPLAAQKWEPRVKQQLNWSSLQYKIVVEARTCQNVR
jgi:hypothetical protein